MSELDSRVLEIEQQCLKGKISPAAAATMIDLEIGGITRVDFNSDSKFKIHNHDKKVLLKVKGVKNRYLRRLYGLAVMSYMKAQENGNETAGSVRISGYASTKHHPAGIHELAREYAET